MRQSLLLLPIVLLTACHTARRAYTSRCDTAVRIQPVAIAYDTVVHIHGDSLGVEKYVSVRNGSAEMNDTTIADGDLYVTLGIHAGKLEEHIRQKDTALRIRGIAHGTDSTYTITRTVTKTVNKKRSISAFILGLILGYTCKTFATIYLNFKKRKNGNNPVTKN